MMKIFVQYFLVLALIVGSAKSQCQLAGDCNECLNIAKPLGDRCTWFEDIASCVEGGPCFSNGGCGATTCTNPEPSTCPGKDKGQCKNFPRNPYKCGDESVGYKCLYDNTCLVKDAGFDIDADCCQAPDAGACPSSYEPVFCGGGDKICPYSNMCLAELAGYSDKQCSPEPGTACPTDILICPGGEMLNRDPDNGCKFPSCPCDSIANCRDCLNEKCAWSPELNGGNGGCAKNCNKVPADASCFFHKLGHDADTCPANEIVWEQAAPTLASRKDGDYFGSNNQLDATGGRFLVSAKKSSEASGLKEAGMVKVYDVRSNGSVRQVGQTLYGYRDGDEVQGVLALSGKRLAMFTPKRDGNAGRVWIYELQSGKWVEIGKIERPKESGERFGDTVAISKGGGIIVVGSTFANNKKGKVSVFRYLGGTAWEQMGSEIPGNFVDGKFGWNIDIASDASTPTFVVGEKSDDADENSGRPGQARVYRWNRSNSKWRMVGNEIQGQNPGDSFGRSVAISADGQTIASGARYFGNKDKGGAFGFQYLGGGSWISQGGVVGDSAGDELFNVAMNKAGDRIAVGSGLGLGYVKVFDYGPSISGAGAWTQIGDTLRGEAFGENFGSDLSLSHDGETLLVGSPSRDNLNQPGSVRLYKLSRKGTHPQYPHISPSIQSAEPDDLGIGVSSMGDEETRGGGATSPAATMKTAMTSFAFSAVIGIAGTLL
eukprot:CAMPEP_0197717378 /NCGR_PEP_ID=MMETSP1434-20131217/1928_1 /TAXON_ID=265543 /ORGANISM="Minutocellus polymorphus, Strain CCMP3303" /LENGTH=713 /DNA_ID=CAMNT_0043301899 /DNA_START=112 /DNA_END=2256 /DNA_ORIENTATION=+